MAAFQSTKGTVLIVSGPSGVGKGTIIGELRRRCPTLGLAISATTRAPRVGEVDRQHYYFLSEAQFDAHIKSGDFLEWCQVHAHRYGTLREEVLRYTGSGNNVILEIDVQGARKVKAQLPDAVSVFIMPPDLDTLYRRLHSRDTDSEAVIKSRLQMAKTEMDAVHEYNYVFVNEEGKLDHVVEKILALMPTC